MQFPNTPGYAVDQIRQAQAGRLIPIGVGYIVVENGQVTLFARSTDAVWNTDHSGGPDPDSARAVQRALQDWQRFIFELLANKPHRLRTPVEIRSRQANPQEPCWLDRQPYQVLVSDDDKLIGYLNPGSESKYVLVVRGETLMAAIWETASTVGLAADSPKKPHGMPLEKPSEP